MISISGKKWTERNINSRIIEKTSNDNNFTYDLSKLVLREDKLKPLPPPGSKKLVLTRDLNNS